MSNALPLGDMSPELLKVVACSHEPHQRKSRMVAISLSGSGEGPGWATAPGYSTTLFLGNRNDSEEALGCQLWQSSVSKCGGTAARRAVSTIAHTLGTGYSQEWRDSGGIEEDEEQGRLSAQELNRGESALGWHQAV